MMIMNDLLGRSVTWTSPINNLFHRGIIVGIIDSDEFLILCDHRFYRVSYHLLTLE